MRLPPSGSQGHQDSTTSGSGVPASSVWAATPAHCSLWSLRPLGGRGEGDYHGWGRVTGLGWGGGADRLASLRSAGLG